MTISGALALAAVVIFVCLFYRATPTAAQPKPTKRMPRQDYEW